MNTKFLVAILFVIAVIFIGTTLIDEMVFAEGKTQDKITAEVYIPAGLPDYYITPSDIEEMEGFEESVCVMAQMLYGECRGLSTYEMSLACWCVLNRVDSPDFPDSVKEVITQKGQFHGYKATNPVDERLFNIAKDVILRWNMEGELVGNSGRTLPKEYLYFYGKDGHNKYRVRNSDPKGIYDFTDVLPDPYKEASNYEQ